MPDQTELCCLMEMQPSEKESSGHSGKGKTFPAHKEHVFHYRVGVYPYTYLSSKTREEKWVTGYIIFPPKLQLLRWTERSRDKFNTHQRRWEMSTWAADRSGYVSCSKPQLRLTVAQLYHVHVNINNCIFNAVFLNYIPVLSTSFSWSLATETLTRATKCTVNTQKPQ